MRAAILHVVAFIQPNSTAFVAWNLQIHSIYFIKLILVANEEKKSPRILVRFSRELCKQREPPTRKACRQQDR